MSLVHNERTKLTANLLNAVAAGIIITGAVAPVVGAIYGIAGPAQASYAALALLTLAWLASGPTSCARRLLARLQP
jgi:hypothetical protein